MRGTLKEIAEHIKNAGEEKNKKVHLIYAFNGTGKTRLSLEFKDLISPKNSEEESEEDPKTKVLYYNAFTEDLFYWDNDLEGDLERKLKIHPNKFTKWIFEEQGQEPNIISTFQHYTSDKLTPRFNEQYSVKDAKGKQSVIDAYSEITFSIQTGDDQNIENIKISKSEESNLIWSVFYSLLEQVIEVLNEAEEAERETDTFNSLEYVFIDDPVSSLDDTHLIELAVNIAELIKSSQSELKFIITTHNPLFYNVLFNEFNNKAPKFGYKAKHSEKSRLEKLSDGTFLFDNQSNDSPFSYHLFLFSELDKVIESGEVHKYHFNLLRNILEKTSTFLGYNNWRELLPDESSGSQKAYYNRILNLSSHGRFSGQESYIIEENDKKVLEYLVREIKREYRFKKIEKEK